jgi:hypothetical protein
MRIEKRTDDAVRCEAWFSEEKPVPLYRYKLSWHWAHPPHLVAWMLNPSTADHEALDNTVKGIEARARAWGYGGLTVINLFAFRTKDPAVMRAAHDPVGPLNDGVILEVLRAAAAERSTILCAWGNDGVFRSRHLEAAALAKTAGVDLTCLIVTKQNQPGHPLYVGHEVVPVPWRPV